MPQTNEYFREYYKNNKDKIKKRAKIWSDNNRDKVLKAQQRYRNNNKERLKPILRKRSKEAYWKNREKRQLYATQRRESLKNELFSAYTNYCNCCRESERAFLTLEHKNRDGKVHRKAVGHTLAQQIVDLKKRGWPDGYEILCFNCNRASWELGICPHRQIKLLAEKKEKATI